MRKKHLLAAAAAAGLWLGISSAQAADISEPVVEPASSWYISLFGGASFLDDVDVEYTFDGIGGEYQDEISTDIGFIVGGAIGTHLTDDIRVELEAAYSENDIDEIDWAGPLSADIFPATGNFGILTFMVNLWYDIPLSEDVKPYIGGGAGVAIVDADVGYDLDDPGLDPIIDSSEVAFAFQAGAGLRFQAWENVTLDIGYRLRGVDGPSFDSKRSDAFPTSDYDADLILSHNVIGGVSLGF